MTGKWSNLPNQKGGAFTVNGYLALVLLALGLIEAAEVYYLATHRTIVFMVPKSVPQAPRKSGSYETHIFPEGRDVCSAFDNICWTRI
jgi:hypothetical protein